jgi:hypothetical protein
VNERKAVKRQKKMVWLPDYKNSGSSEVKKELGALISAMRNQMTLRMNEKLQLELGMDDTLDPSKEDDEPCSGFDAIVTVNCIGELLIAQAADSYEDDPEKGPAIDFLAAASHALDKAAKKLRREIIRLSPRP